MRHIPLLFAALVLPLLPACDQRAGVSVQDEPHAAPALPAPTSPSMPAMPKTQVVLGQSLWAGGIKAQDGRWLIFKTIGPADAVAKHRAELEALANNEAEALPPGWRKDEATSQFGRIATLRAPAPELEVSVSLAGGDLAGNINRWRGQAGWDALTPEQAAQQIKVLDEKSGAWSFEVAGKIEATKEPAPSAAPAAAKQSPGTAPLSFSLPAGWKTVNPSNDMRLAQFDADGCEVAITRFPGQIGGKMGPVLANLNLWRSQVGLAPLSELPKTAQAVGMTVADYPAAMVQVAATEGEPVAEKAMVITFVPDAQGTFFIKLTGPTAKVEAQLMPMVDFLKTLKLPFEGAPAPLPADLRLLPKIGK